LASDQLTILKYLTQTGGTGNLMEILDYDFSRFERGFSLANEMQNLTLIKLLYSNFNRNLIVVELTLVGESNAQNNG
jgi:hypothetical protein